MSCLIWAYCCAGCTDGIDMTRPSTVSQAHARSEADTEMQEMANVMHAGSPQQSRYVPYAKDLDINFSIRSLENSKLYHREADGNEICTNLHGSTFSALRAWLQHFRDAVGPEARRGYKVRVENENLKKRICIEYSNYQAQNRVFDHDLVAPGEHGLSDILQRVAGVTRERHARNSSRPDYRRLAHGS